MAPGVRPLDVEQAVPIRRQPEPLDPEVRGLHHLCRGRARQRDPHHEGAKRKPGNDRAVPAVKPRESGAVRAMLAVEPRESGDPRAAPPAAKQPERRDRAGAEATTAGVAATAGHPGGVDEAIAVLVGVARIAEHVAVLVGLVGVRHGRAVVEPVGHAVAVTIAATATALPPPPGGRVSRVVVTVLLVTVLGVTPILKAITARLAYAPSAVTPTVTVTLPDAPTARLPRVQVTVPAALLPPLLALTNVEPAGIGSVIVALFAVPVPVLA